MDIYGVVMAGGGGSRLWPLSRKSFPKQLLNLTGGDLMVNESIVRLAQVTGFGHIIVVTNNNQFPKIREATSKYIDANQIIKEPVARNTAACIGFAAVEVLKRYNDGVMVITPSDHYILQEDEYSRILKLAVTAAEKSNKIITIGIPPTFPSTGFGYIKYSQESGEIKQVEEFVEKPNIDKANSYLASKCYAWNSGVYICKASIILQYYKKFVPDIYLKLMNIYDAIGTQSEKNIIESIYPTIREISIDYAIMEPTSALGGVLVILGVFGWNDVGSLDMMDIIHKPDNDGNVIIGDSVALSTSNSIIYSSNRLVAALGVDNIVIVETADAILVCSKDKAQNVKMIVDELVRTGRNDLI